MLLWRISVVCQKKDFLDCRSSRGRSETVFLYECRDDLTAHLNFVVCRVQTSKSTRSSCKGLASNICHMNKLKNTCLSSPSLWSWKVLETFKVVSVPRTVPRINPRTLPRLHATNNNILGVQLNQLGIHTEILSLSDHVRIRSPRNRFLTNNRHPP